MQQTFTKTLGQGRGFYLHHIRNQEHSCLKSPPLSLPASRILAIRPAQPHLLSPSSPSLPFVPGHNSRASVPLFCRPLSVSFLHWLLSNCAVHLSPLQTRAVYTKLFFKQQQETRLPDGKLLIFALLRSSDTRFLLLLSSARGWYLTCARYRFTWDMT